MLCPHMASSNEQDLPQSNVNYVLLQWSDLHPFHFDERYRLAWSLCSWRHFCLLMMLLALILFTRDAQLHMLTCNPFTRGTRFHWLTCEPRFNARLCRLTLNHAWHQQLQWCFSLRTKALLWDHRDETTVASRWGSLTRQTTQCSNGRKTMMRATLSSASSFLCFIPAWCLNYDMTRHAMFALVQESTSNRISACSVDRSCDDDNNHVY